MDGGKFAIRLDGPSATMLAISAIRRAPMGYTVEIAPETRTKVQNRLLWPLLADVARQVEWHGLRLSQDDWKDMFTAGLKNLRVVPNLDGSGFVALGQRTSTMSKRTFSDLIELIFAFGSDRGVSWSRKSGEAITEARAA